MILPVLPDSVPPHLADYTRSVLTQLEGHLDGEQQHKLEQILTDTALLSEQLCRALVGSQYVLESVCAHPQLLFGWLLVDTPYAPLSPQQIVDMVELSCCECANAEELGRTLRQLRRRLMVAIIWRDVNRLSDFAEISHSMTTMAETCIQQALDFHYRTMSAKHGLPMGQHSRQVQPLLVLGMGKLGGSELNLSSDIDLIFTFPEAGETASDSHSIDNQSFFIRLGQRLIKTLNEITVDGFVFRVDMRLRPYGQSGALVSNFTALENYYHTQGRDWERFAVIKARVVACSAVPDDAVASLQLQQQNTEQLAAILRPFAYRCYTDFSVIDSLRKLKAMIVQEVRRKGMSGNVKLGAGGIRELEFIVQSFQLVRGGRELQLQERHWLTVLQCMCEEQVLEPEVIHGLRDAYLFLRNAEHAIQAWKDEQTQQLPMDETAQQVLAWVMGFDTWGGFLEALDQHCGVVNQQFQWLIAEPQDKSAHVQVDSDIQHIWRGAHQEQALAILQARGVQQPEDIWQQLQSLQHCWAVTQVSDNSREVLDVVVPQALATVLSLKQPDVAALRLLTWLEKVVGRSSYITLLLENPMVLRHLCILFEGSVWITELLGQMPALLDELLDTDSLYTLPSRQQLQDELRQRLLRIDMDDVEAFMEVLRYFKLAHHLRVAASDLAGSLPLMKVSDYLTWIAEVVLEQVLNLAWAQVSGKYGVPKNTEAARKAVYSLEGFSSLVQEMVPGFAIIGYGKLGGIELSYSSDLDLVFIYEADLQGVTDGKKPLDVQTFYTRLGQKIIHLLNMRSLSGPLYEVDMRLRPSGNSGLLASSLTAFSRYQHNDAWIWEHQALVRARPLVGDVRLLGKFSKLRREVLEQPRELAELRQAVVEMRQKMRNHLGSAKKSPLFHLKQDTGGIVDIEFMVQYAVLALTHQHPDFAEYTDNIRLLEYLQVICTEEGGHSLNVTSAQVEALVVIYQAYREVSHRLALQKQSSSLTEEQVSKTFVTYSLPEKREQVASLWKRLFVDV